MQIGRDPASEDADFPQLVSAMRLSSGECVKCVQITYLTSENTTQREMYLMSKYKRLQLNIRET